MLATLGQARYFCRLDAYSGFYYMKLRPESTHLTTFITPFGQFKFNRLPLGISCAPEHFQRMMHQRLEGLDGVVCHKDDILVWTKSKEEHDSRLHDSRLTVCVRPRNGQVSET